MAKGVIRRQIIELLAVLLDQGRHHGVSFHLRGAANPEDVPVAARACHGVRVASGNDLQDSLLVRDLRYRERLSGVATAQKEIDVVAVDQLVRLLNRCSGVAARRIFDRERQRSAEYAPLTVDLVDRQLTTDKLVFSKRRDRSGQWIVDPNL